VWIVREETGIYAVFAKCTHLGCTPRWLAAEAKFKCPCHGSGFFKSGLNFEGPAPRPLDRFQVTIAEDGQLVVDKSKVFRMGPGAEPDEQHSQSILKV
jgi:cytochrome b6-f complex iron-sulfur subunit